MIIKNFTKNLISKTNINKLLKLSISNQLNIVLISSISVLLLIVSIFIYSVNKKEAFKYSELIAHNELESISMLVETEVTKNGGRRFFQMNALVKILEGYGNWNIKKEKQIELPANINTDKDTTLNINPLLLGDINIENNDQFINNLKKTGYNAISFYRNTPLGLVCINTTISDRQTGNKVIYDLLDTTSTEYTTVNNKSRYLESIRIGGSLFSGIFQPIVINGKTEGAIFVGVFEKNNTFLLSLFENKKIYETGFPYLFNKNGFINAHPQLAGKNITDATPELQKIRAENKSEGLLRFYNDSTQQWEHHYYKELPVINSYIGVKIDEAKILEAPRRFRNILLSSILLVIIIIFIIIKQINKTISPPLKKGINFAKQIADGNLNVRLEKISQHEIGELTEALNHMAQKLRTTVSGIAKISDEMQEKGNSLKNQSIKFSENATQQASSLEEISASMEEISTNVEQTKENVEKSEKVAKEAVNDIKESNIAVHTSLKSLLEITNKIGIINDIAFKTNLLALNASIEAAHAGEFGRAFSVVAQEVKNLSEKSNQEAKGISKSSSNGIKIAEDASSKLEKSVPYVEETATMIQNIVVASIEQAMGIDQVNVAIQSLNENTQQNSLNSQSLNNLAIEMHELANKLNDIVIDFDTED